MAVSPNLFGLEGLDDFDVFGGETGDDAVSARVSW